MYLPEILIGLAVLIILIMALITSHLEKGRLEARETAERLQQQLKERPIQRIVYSDDVIESKIADYVEFNYMERNQDLVTLIRNKEYLK